MKAALETLTREAGALLDQRRNDEAIDLIRSAEAPNESALCALLARAYYQRGDAKGDMHAASFFSRRAAELGDTSAEVLAIRGLSAFRREQYAEAVEAFAGYVTDQSLAATQFMYGLALHHDGQAVEALKWIDRALETEPDQPAFREARARAQKLAALRGRPKTAGAAVAEKPLKLPTFTLGGIADVRPEGAPAPYRHNALSKLRGHGNQPKDFHWLARNIPCQAACPARTDIPGYLGAIFHGEYDEAYRINLRDNVFPGVLGRVCARPCEAECRHGWSGLGESVAICFSKRAAADWKQQDPVVLEPWFEPSGKRVAIIGAGVAGLAAARQLALLGHAVTVYEKHAQPGGMMNQGIPAFRLPRDVIDREIEQIRLQGVQLRCNTRIGGDLSLQQLLAENDAVVLAAGTLRPNLLDLPGKELGGIRHGLDFLLEVNDTGWAEVGKRVMVIGGGFTAMDCARVAQRLGAPTVHVCYRRSRAEMLVTPGELEELEHEGIPVDYMVTPIAYLGEAGHVTHVRFIRTELGAPDDSGRRRPVELPGAEFNVPATTVLLATGQFPDTAWIDEALRETLVEDDGWLKSGGAHATAVSKLFVAGDFATGALSLIDAIGHAKDTAREVDKFLMGEERLVDVAVIEDATETGRIREMDAVPCQGRPALPTALRTLTAEVEHGYSQPLAVDETQRCYLCSHKYEIDADKCLCCDWCVKAKPRPNCIVEAGSLIYDESDRIVGYNRAAGTEDKNLIWINQADCIRCHACVDACPVDCISLQRVSWRTVPKHEAQLEPVSQADFVV
ncbi:MAG: 4Fe-4S ferredoxin [Armatimonadetes bacterium CG17_big_fil_post_rev_8_21_14_2_50_66_6]|nr:MAG: 4Fe-4S ferredoxin [Armatimonadetes bacterium CG17_big_fil_post_rev_8_21_14_2_50_66_6]